jgi:adenylylsulfate kinase
VIVTKRKILICGLPGAGKTTLAKVLRARLNAVHFNADEVRANINKDLGFTHEDRVEHATRMGWLCDRVVETGGFAIADFICPTEQTRNAFFKDGEGAIVFVDRITTGRFTDTNAMFEPPLHVEVRVTEEHQPEYWAERVAMLVRPVFDWKKSTALFVGRYQPFHDGHRALVIEGLERVGQVCIAVRELRPDTNNPFDFEYVRSRIEHSLMEYQGRFVVIPLPNISHIFYGRDVGYKVERIDLDEITTRISATTVRSKMGGGNGTAVTTR